MKNFALKELTLSITDGKHGDCKNEENSGYYFISCKDIKDGNIFYEDARQITKEDFIETHKRTKLERDDILVTNSGTIGRMAFVTDTEKASRTTFQKSVAILKPNKEKIIPLYLYYSIKANIDSLAGTANGAAQKNLLLSTMRDFNIPIHTSFSKQHKIVSILSAYDDLIENNKKQIKLLEEAAQRLYKEWFVDLRFPGHENVPVVDGVPEGWSVGTIDSIIALQGGFSFKSSEFSEDGTYKVITIKNVKDGAFDSSNTSMISAIPNKMPSHCYIHDGDILMSLTGNIGRVCIAYGKNLLLNQRVAKIKSDFYAYSYCLFRSEEIFYKMNSLANGAAQQNLSPIRTGKIMIVIPSDSMLKKFELFVRPIIKKMEILNRYNCDLAETRDFLLPKLMSGEIEV